MRPNLEIPPPPSPGASTIRLAPEDRFVPTPILRGAYLHFEGSRTPAAPNPVHLDDGTWNVDTGFIAAEESDLAAEPLSEMGIEDAANRLRQFASPRGDR